MGCRSSGGGGGGGRRRRRPLVCVTFVFVGHLTPPVSSVSLVFRVSVFKLFMCMYVCAENRICLCVLYNMRQDTRRRCVRWLNTTEDCSRIDPENKQITT